MRNKIFVCFHKNVVSMIWDSFKTVYRKGNRIGENTERKHWNHKGTRGKALEKRCIGGSSILNNWEEHYQNLPKS